MDQPVIYKIFFEIKYFTAKFNNAILYVNFSSKCQCQISTMHRIADENVIYEHQFNV